MKIWIELHGDGGKLVKDVKTPLQYCPPIVRFGEDVFVWSGYDRHRNKNVYRKTEVYEVY